MQSRQEIILKLVIETYIHEAEPVGSKALSGAEDLDVSAATIRNDMAELAENGFLNQPHTSSGRVPTQKAYEYFLQHLMCYSAPQSLVERFSKLIRSSSDADTALKSLAKGLAELSGETVFVAYDPKWSFYTGMSNLFRKPEFAYGDAFDELSQIVDAFDDVVAGFFNTASDSPAILFGKDNPFGENMGSVVVRCPLVKRDDGVLGIVGPMRMDYQKNLYLIQAAQAALSKYE